MGMGGPNMNKTQKGAWLLLGMGALLFGFVGIIYASLVAGGSRLAGVDAVKFWAGLIVAFIIAAVALVHRKQSPAEPKSDERDDTIKKNAVLACFISVWISLVLASFVPTLVVGDNGSIPVFFLPVINLMILFVAFLVYGVAVLVQYGRARKGDPS
jgi:hypothetical protein